MKFLLLEHYVDNTSTYFIHYSHSLEFWKERKNNHDPPSVTNRNAPRPFIQSSPLSPTSTSERWRKRKESFDRAWKQSKEKRDGTEREREPTFISTGNTESAASSSSSSTTAASGRHSGDVVNEQSFEPNMLSPRSVEPIFNLSRCGARASASRFPVCQTGKPGQTFELAQTVWHPTTYRLRGPRILNMLLYHRHRFICGCLSSPTSNVCLSLCPRNFLPPRPLPSLRSAESSKVVHMHIHAAPRFRPEMSPFSRWKSLILTAYLPVFFLADNNCGLQLL